MAEMSSSTWVPSSAETGTTASNGWRPGPAGDDFEQRSLFVRDQVDLVQGEEGRASLGPAIFCSRQSSAAGSGWAASTTAEQHIGLVDGAEGRGHDLQVQRSLAAKIPGVS